MSKPLSELRGGDRRSIGKTNLVTAQALKQPGLLAMIVDGLSHDDAVVRIRSADVAEKVSRARPEFLVPHKAAILALLRTTQAAELRWHLAQMTPRLSLDRAERADARSVLATYLNDRSRIVQAAALEALVELAIDDPAQALAASRLVDQFAATGSPLVRARARKLKARLVR